ncbi:hypothetical protein AAMO2058_001275200 [Amorphochlora amoebiformis]
MSIPMAKRRRPSEASQQYAFDSSTLLRTPQDFLKHVSKKKPHRRWVVCSADLKEVRWASSKLKLNTISAKTAKVKDLTRVTLGWETPVFKKSMQKGRDECCFSLVFANRTLDLQAKSEQQRDKWAKCFLWLLKEKAQGKLLSSVGLPFNVVHKTHVNTNFEWSDVNLEEEFELGKELGKGAFGVVCLGRHKSSGLELAIKKINLKINGEKPEDIKAEVAVLKKCRHANIVSFFGCAGPDPEDKMWLMMEVCSGGSLRDLLDACGNLDEEQIQYVCAGMLKALQYLHAKKIVHRDLKAGNVLLTQEGKVKLTDFGISMSLGQTKSLGERKSEDSEVKLELPDMEKRKNKEVYANNTVAGSPLWMAPEVIMGAGAVFLSDVWSLGITLIELAEGIPPHAYCRSAIHVMTNITRSPPPRLEEKGKWSEGFHDILKTMLQKKTEDRPGTQELLVHPFVSSALFTIAAKESPLIPAMKNRLRARRAEKLAKLAERREQKLKQGKKVTDTTVTDAPEDSETEESDDDSGGSMVIHHDVTESTKIQMSNGTLVLGKSHKSLVNLSTPLLEPADSKPSGGHVPEPASDGTSVCGCFRRYLCMML